MRRFSFEHQRAWQKAREKGVKQFVGDKCGMGHVTWTARPDGSCYCQACDTVRHRERRAGAESRIRGIEQWGEVTRNPHRPVQAIPVAPDGFIRAPTLQQLMAGR